MLHIYKANTEFALECLRAALNGGARWIVLCDTNGGRLPDEIVSGVEAAVAEVTVPLGIHCHNDADVAVANTIAGVQAGATQVQGTINGYGERCGNANLLSLIPNLKLKLGIDVVTDEQLQHLTEAEDQWTPGSLTTGCSESSGHRGRIGAGLPAIFRWTIRGL